MGKKPVVNKKEAAAKVMELVPLGDSTPCPPVLDIIAQHLIAQHAFRTTASLNVASKVVHHETLPTLYESFFFDDFKRRRNGDGGPLPAGVKFTKYLFYTTCRDGEKPFPRLYDVTNIVMTIAVDTSTIKEPGVAHIRVYRHVSSATATKILQTPFRHRLIGSDPAAHTMCTSSLHLMSMLQLTGIIPGGEPRHMPFTNIPVAQDCLDEQARADVQPITHIRKVFLESAGAQLHGRHPVRACIPKTTLRLHNLEITCPGKRTSNADVVCTAIELLKLSAQGNAQHLVEAEKKLVHEHGFGNGRFGAATCFLRLGYVEWHLNLVMDAGGARLFIDTLKEQAEKYPKMLWNRLNITIIDHPEPEDVQTILDSLHKLYRSKITGMHHVLPSRSNPPELVRCTAMTRTTTATAGTDAVVALVVTKLTGTIKAVPKKRGVVIVLDIDEAGDPGRTGAFIEEV